MSRPIDVDSPSYLEGVGLANRILDTGEGGNASDWIRRWEIVAEFAHQNELVELYHQSAGCLATMREYVESQGS